MGKVEEYLKTKTRKKYYCLSCFQYAKERHFLQTMQVI